MKNMKNMKTNRHRIISAVAALLLSMSVLMPFSVFAYSQQQNGLNSNYRISGNGADDIVAVAKAQLGKRYPSFKGFHYRAWCADFVSACAASANQSNAVPGNASVAGLRTAIRNAGGTEYSKSTIQNRRYTPKKGDIIIFKSNGDSHVGIVDCTSGTTIYYIDGNNTANGNGNNACVHYSNRSFSYRGFTCVIAPRYSNRIIVPKSHTPEGHVDSVSSDSPNRITVRGWAFDKDVPNKSIGIHVYVGGPAGSGAPGYAITTDSDRPDVNRAYSISGIHGFSKTINVTRTGTQTVYIYAINEGGGNTNPLIGTKTVTIRSGGYAPQGCVDLVTSGSAGTLRVAGWAFDRDTPSKSICIHVYVGGPAGSGAPGYAIMANTGRPDVNRVYGLSGNHGFDRTLNVSRKGNQTIYFYAINQGTGGNPLFAKRTINIK